MPKSCCVKNSSNSTKNNENVKIYLLPKDKLRPKLWLNAIGQVYIDIDGNIDYKRIWSPPSHFKFMFAQNISSMISLF